MLKYLPPFSSAVSLPRDVVSNLTVAWYMLWRHNGRSSSYKLQDTDVNLAFLHVMFSDAFESFLWLPRSRTMC